MKRSELKPWDRKPGETEPAYAAFHRYLMMGADGEARSVTKLSRDASKNRQVLSNWKTKWFWQERVDAWDKTVLEEERKAYMEERRKMSKRHAQMGIAMQAQALKALKEVDLSQAYLKDIVMMINSGVKIERIARNTETDIKAGLENEKLRAEIERLKAGLKAEQNSEAGIVIIDDIQRKKK